MPVFPITGSDFECHIYETLAIGTVGDPAAATGPGWRAQIRRINGTDWINVPSRFGSSEEALLAVQEYLNEHFNSDDGD